MKKKKKKKKKNLPKLLFSCEQKYKMDISSIT